MLIIDCRRSSELLSRREDEPLAKAERFQLGLHVTFCPTCRAVSEQIGFLRAAMRRLDEDKAD